MTITDIAFNATAENNFIKKKPLLKNFRQRFNRSEQKLTFELNFSKWHSSTKHL